MTKEITGAIVTCAAILLGAGIVFSAEQSSPGSPTKTTEQKQTSKAAPDNWGKMKDCAEQAVKAMVELDRQNMSRGARASDGWSNHYSPKYNRCFVKAEYIAATDKDAVKGGPFLRTRLIDAFELANVALSSTGVSPEVLCRLDVDPKECERRASGLWICQIEEEKSDCAKVEQFINEHMKN
jgi:hypothetical protein